MTFQQALNTTFDESVGHTPVGMVVGCSLGAMIPGRDEKRLKTGFKLIEFELRNQAIKRSSDQGSQPGKAVWPTGTAVR
ncbi:hypothetical protein [Pseudomonas kribbensis]|uniref:hypothetical protein n=1 Tax=Pseudomonas kribbensis TaxID=1628086 RepID=UPI0013B3D971|nr:hypothetical protein [Pseudomonas kribbensis]